MFIMGPQHDVRVRIFIMGDTIWRQGRNVYHGTHTSGSEYYSETQNITLGWGCLMFDTQCDIKVRMFTVGLLTWCQGGHIYRWTHNITSELGYLPLDTQHNVRVGMFTVGHTTWRQGQDVYCTTHKVTPGQVVHRRTPKMVLGSGCWT